MVKVSAIVSVYKARRFIEGCLEDLIGQSLYRSGELEIVVVDSNSPEEESAIINRFQKQYPRISYIRTEERESLYQSWNRGMDIAQGEFVTNANCDDRHRPDCIEKLLSAIEARPEIDLVYGDARRCTRENARFDDLDNGELYRYPEFFQPDVVLYFQFGCQPLWRRGLKSTVGYFNPEYRAAGDWEYNFRFNLAGRNAIHIAEPLGLFYENPDSVSLQGGQSDSEQQQLRRVYGSAATVLQLYRAAGWPVESPSDKALALFDMSKRCFDFELPWCPGKTFSDKVFAQQMFAAGNAILDGTSA